MDLSIEGLNFRYANSWILKDFHFSFSRGKGYSLLGPSGCGKTTLLKILAGLLKPQSGLVKRDGLTSFLFQEPRLIPQRNLMQNLELPLYSLYEKEERKKRVAEMLEKMDLSSKGNSFPHQLSGGMQQRAAMGRAFLYPSSVLLMDEPFKGLDPLLRIRLIQLLKDMLKENPRTLIAVTHQVDEAIMISSQILFLQGSPIKIDRQWEHSLAPEDQHPGGQGFSQLEDSIHSHWWSRATEAGYNY